MYTPNPEWKDGFEGKTPIRAENLNHIEEGLRDAAAIADAAQPKTAMGQYYTQSAANARFQTQAAMSAYETKAGASATYATKAQSASDNMVVVNNRRYEASGIMDVTPTKWDKEDWEMHLCSLTVQGPYEPPAGYGFLLSLAGSSGFDFMSTVGFSGRSTVVRYLRCFNSALATVRVAWQLVKVS